MPVFCAPHTANGHESGQLLKTMWAVAVDEVIKAPAGLSEITQTSCSHHSRLIKLGSEQQNALPPERLEILGASWHSSH